MLPRTVDETKMRRQLLRSGYPDVDGILRDEMQAYVAGNGELLGADCVAVVPVAKQIRGVFDAYATNLMQASDDAGKGGAAGDRAPGTGSEKLSGPVSSGRSAPRSSMSDSR